MKMVEMCWMLRQRVTGWRDAVLSTVSSKRARMLFFASCISALSLAAFAERAESNATSGLVPPIVTQAPIDSSKDVRIHFYIDAHKSMLPGDAYKRAANGLRIMLDDINNPIKKGLRDRMVGERVEVNTGMAYLIKPKEIVPFSLSGDVVLPIVKAESGKWDIDSLVQMILDGPEKQTKNIVVCVISNDPNLKHSHGVFHKEKERGLVFFMLWAPKESVDGSLFHPYWDAKEWSAFLRSESGTTANNIADEIVDRYYKLTEKEIAGLSAITCEAREREIFISRIRSLPEEKDMWTATLTLNGKVVPRDRDEHSMTPEIGQNRVVASMVSPTGLIYTRVWEGKDINYFSLEADRNLLNDAKKVLADAETNNVMQGLLAAELKAAVENPTSPMTKTAMEAFKANVVTFQERVRLNIGLKDLEKKIAAAESLLDQIKRLDKKDAYLTSRTEIGKSLTGFKKLNEKVGSTAVATANLEMDDAVKRLTGIKDELEREAEQKRREAEIEANIEKGYEAVRSAIQKRRVEVDNQVKKENKNCRNYKDLADFEARAKTARDSKDKDALLNVSKTVAEWMPDLQSNELPSPPPPEITKEDVLKRIAEIRKQIATRTAGDLAECTNLSTIDAFEGKVKAFDDANKEGIKALWNKASKIKPEYVDVASMRDALKKKIQEKLDDSNNSNDKIENRHELDGYLSNANDANTVTKVKSLDKDVDEWKRDERGGSWLLMVLLIVAIVVIAMLTYNKFFNKPVATMKYVKAGSADAGETADIRVNKQISFAQAFKDCTLDVLVTYKKTDGKGFEYYLSSPNRKIWLQKSGGEKEELGKVELPFNDGDYDLFDQQFAIDAIGSVKFSVIE